METTLEMRLAVAACAVLSLAAFPWQPVSEETLEQRIAPPPGFERAPAAPGTAAAWLRSLPLHPKEHGVRLYDGRPKPGPAVHQAVFDIDVGSRDLQQCADAAMRLRAEYLLAQGCADEIAFRFTSGDPARWQEWSGGMRPQVEGNRVSWNRSSQPAADYATFRRYLDTVFVYAGSASLSREMERVEDSADVQAGDLFLEGGFPGHAVIVVDVAVSPGGERRFLLAQSYMPAQEIHVLRNPADATSPWYAARSSGRLVTPEWEFDYSDLFRFPATSCDR